MRVCRRLDARGLVAGAEGNVSVRLGSTVIVTPAGARKGDVRSANLVAVDLASGRATSKGVASSELSMHLAIYRTREDVGAVVHAHPPTATGFAVARTPLPVGALAELAGVIGPVPVVGYYTPGTADLGRAVAESLHSADVALLSNHGAVAVGEDVDSALNLMESLEQAARILVSAHILGGVTLLGDDQVLELQRGRRRAKGRQE